MEAPLLSEDSGLKQLKKAIWKMYMEADYVQMNGFLSKHLSAFSERDFLYIFQKIAKPERRRGIINKVLEAYISVLLDLMEEVHRRVEDENQQMFSARVKSTLSQDFILIITLVIHNGRSGSDDPFPRELVDRLKCTFERMNYPIDELHPSILKEIARLDFLPTEDLNIAIRNRVKLVVFLRKRL